MPQKPPTVGEMWWQQLVNEPDTEPGKVLGQFEGKDLPPVVTPRQFRPQHEPFVVGSELGKRVQRMLDLAPSLRGKLKSVIQGPTSASISRVTGSGFRPDAFEDTTLLGITDRAPGHVGEVGLSPGLKTGHEYQGTTLEDVLAHELAHVGGANELGARAAEQAFGADREGLEAGKYLKKLKLYALMSQMKDK